MTSDQVLDLLKLMAAHADDETADLGLVDTTRWPWVRVAVAELVPYEASTVAADETPPAKLVCLNHPRLDERPRVEMAGLTIFPVEGAPARTHLGQCPDCGTVYCTYEPAVRYGSNH